jgi:hypothetical protein
MEGLGPVPGPVPGPGPGLWKRVGTVLSASATLAALAACLLAAWWLGDDGATGEARFADPGCAVDPDPCITRSFTWRPVAAVVAAALAVRLLVLLLRGAMPRRLTTVVVPLVTAAAGAALVLVSYPLPYAYGSRCGGGECVVPLSESGYSLGTPFLLPGAVVALLGIALSAREPARAVVTTGVCLTALGAFLLVVSPAIVEGGNVDSIHVGGPAVPVGVGGFVLVFLAPFPYPAFPLAARRARRPRLSRADAGERPPRPPRRGRARAGTPADTSRGTAAARAGRRGGRHM